MLASNPLRNSRSELIEDDESSVALPTRCSVWERDQPSGGGLVSAPGLGLTPIGPIDSAMPQKTHVEAST